MKCSKGHEMGLVPAAGSATMEPFWYCERCGAKSNKLFKAPRDKMIRGEEVENK